MEGIEKLVAIKGSINKSLSSKLKEIYSIIPVKRPLVLDLPVPDPQWLAGFTSGEGCFFVIHKSKSCTLGEAVQLKFILVQHERDEQLMKNIKEYFDCGNLLKKRETIHFTISNFTALTDKNYSILPKISNSRS